MDSTFLKSLTNPQIFILFPAVSCGLLLVMTLLLRRFRYVLGLKDYDGDILDTATQNTMSGAYVVLGFVLVLAMTTVTELDNQITNEATAIKSLERLLTLEGSAESLTTRTNLISYTDSIIRDEWPVMREGSGSQKTSAALKDVFKNIDDIKPVTAKDIVVYSKILEQADKLAELRNSRIFTVKSQLPHTFYVVSILSIFGVLVLCALRLIEATRERSIALYTQIAMLALMFSAIAIVDLPYLGETVTLPDAIEAAFKSMSPDSLKQ